MRRDDTERSTAPRAFPPLLPHRASSGRSCASRASRSPNGGRPSSPTSTSSWRRGQVGLGRAERRREDDPPRVLIGRQDADAGSVFRGKNMNIGYFAQEARSSTSPARSWRRSSSVEHPPPPEAWQGASSAASGSEGRGPQPVGQLSGGNARVFPREVSSPDYDLLVPRRATNHSTSKSQRSWRPPQTYPLVVRHRAWRCGWRHVATSQLRCHTRERSAGRRHDLRLSMSRWFVARRGRGGVVLGDDFREGETRAFSAADWPTRLWTASSEQKRPRRPLPTFRRGRMSHAADPSRSVRRSRAPPPPGEVADIQVLAAEHGSASASWRPIRTSRRVVFPAPFARQGRPCPPSQLEVDVAKRRRRRGLRDALRRTTPDPSAGAEGEAGRRWGGGGASGVSRRISRPQLAESTCRTPCGI